MGVVLQKKFLIWKLFYLQKKLCINTLKFTIKNYAATCLAFPPRIDRVRSLRVSFASRRRNRRRAITRCPCPASCGAAWAQRCARVQAMTVDTQAVAPAARGAAAR